MKVTSMDYKYLKTIGIWEISAYLETHNWTKSKLKMAKNIIWEHLRTGEKKLYLSIPSKTTFIDYEDRLAEAIEKLERIEERSQDIILKDIMSTGSDVIRIKPEKYESNLETLPFEEGVAFIEGTQELLISAACSAITPKKTIPTLKPQPVQDYLKEVKLGQTERGSYVITVHSPIPLPTLKRSNLFEGEPFSRRVTKTLIKAANASVIAAEISKNKGDLSIFEEYINKGISANLLKAIAKMQEETHASSLLINVSWSPRRELREKIVSSVEIKEEIIPTLKEASEMLEEPEPVSIENFNLVGKVTKLHRETEEEVGSITIAGHVQNVLRHVNVTLSNVSDYNIAIKAHEKKLPVICVGNLRRKGTVSKLEEYRGFQIVEIGNLGLDSS